MRARIKLVALAAGLAMGLVLAASALAGRKFDEIAARGTLIAAAVPDTLPQSARDKSGNFVGFDIDVAREIAKRLNLGIKFVTPGWEAILAGGWGDAFDIAVASVTPTEERARRLTFPATYRYDAAVLLVHKENLSILEPADASGKIVGTKKDTTFEKYLQRRLDVVTRGEPVEYVIADPQIKLYAGKGQALAALAKGDGKELDAVVMSFAPARTAIAGGAPARVIPGFLFFEPVAVAIDKGDQDFARAVERVVLNMSGDGTLSEMSKKWFGVDLTSGAFGPAQ